MKLNNLKLENIFLNGIFDSLLFGISLNNHYLEEESKDESSVMNIFTQIIPIAGFALWVFDKLY